MYVATCTYVCIQKYSTTIRLTIGEGFGGLLPVYGVKAPDPAPILTRLGPTNLEVSLISGAGGEGNGDWRMLLTIWGLPKDLWCQLLPERR